MLADVDDPAGRRRHLEGCIVSRHVKTPRPGGALGAEVIAKAEFGNLATLASISAGRV